MVSGLGLEIEFEFPWDIFLVKYILISQKLGKCSFTVG